MRSDIQRQVDRQMVRFIIGRQIFCPINGVALDIDTAKWFVDEYGDPAYVLSPEAYDAAVSHPGIVAGLAKQNLFPME